MKKIAVFLVNISLIMIIIGMFINIHDLKKDYEILQNENDSLKITILYQGDEINRLYEENNYLWEYYYINENN